MTTPAGLVATVGGIGLMPWAPGTWASLLALPVGWLLLAGVGVWGLVGATLTVTVAGIWSAARVADATGIEDPSMVVIDEVAGQWVTLVGLAFLIAEPSAVEYAIAFVAFRVFDIAKPWPVSWADRRVDGGLGVMLDDLLAGGYAIVVVAGYHWVVIG